MINSILLVEDDKKIARVVKVYLEGAGYRVLHCERAKDAVEVFYREKPILVILDLMLPDKSGEELCQEFKETADTSVIMLTAKSSEDERVAGFALGADDYIVKPFSPREMVYRVKAVLKRAQKKGIEADKPMSFNGNILIIDGAAYEIKKNDSIVDLTPTEFRILYLLSSSPGRVFTREDLVEKALGYQFEGYERSVDAHIKNLRHKIEDDPKKPSFITTIYGVGYRFSGKRDD
ncbi:MAG: response regulator transcription factor [Nitrospirae bacterium]|nr:response regulator transcription factor [Nitrospirota bacterium]